MRTHINILGWLLIATHVLYVIAALFIFIGFSAAGAVSASTGHEGVGIAALLASIGTFLGVILMLVGLPGLIIGWYLLKRAPWARIAGIIFCILMLLNVSTAGVTTIIGIYGLWVLFNSESTAIFEGRIAG